MVATSRLAAAEDGLFGLLEDAKAVPGSPIANVPLSHGWPGDLLETEHLWIEEDATTTLEDRVTGSGGTGIVERGVLTVAVWVNTPGNDYVASRDRAHAIAGEVESVVAANFNLDEANVMASGVVRLRRGPAPAENARGIFIELDVEYLAWLT